MVRTEDNGGLVLCSNVVCVMRLYQHWHLVLHVMLSLRKKR